MSRPFHQAKQLRPPATAVPVTSVRSPYNVLLEQTRDAPPPTQTRDFLYPDTGICVSSHTGLLLVGHDAAVLNMRLQCVGTPS